MQLVQQKLFAPVFTYGGTQSYGQLEVMPVVDTPVYTELAGPLVHVTHCPSTVPLSAHCARYWPLRHPVDVVVQATHELEFL